MNEDMDIEKIIENIKNDIANEINMEEIVKELKLKVKNENLQCDIPKIEEALDMFLKERIAEKINFLNARCEIRYYREIENSNKLVVFVKRVVRKLMCFCIQPMATDQSGVNLTLMQIVSMQQKQIKSMNETILLLQKQINNK